MGKNIIFPDWILIFSPNKFSHFLNTKLTTILKYKWPFIIVMERSSWYFQPISPYFHSTTIKFKQFFASFFLFLVFGRTLMLCAACEIYEALSAILWEVSRQRAPIFFRDHFLIVFLQQLIVQSWTQSKREWCGRCFLNCELIFGRRLSFLNQTSILSVLHLIGGNFVVTHQHWFGGSIMIKGSRLFQLFVHILLFAAFEAGTTHFHSIHLSL